MLGIHTVGHERLRDVENEGIEELLGRVLSGGCATRGMAGVGRLERQVDEVRDRQRDEERSDQPEAKWRPEVIAEHNEEVGEVNGCLRVGDVGDDGNLASGLEWDESAIQTVAFEQKAKDIDRERRAECFARVVGVLGDLTLLVQL